MASTVVARAHQRALLIQVIADLFKHDLDQVVGDQQRSESQRRGEVVHQLVGKVDIHEIPLHLAVVDRILKRLVGQAVQLLEQIQAQLIWTPLSPGGRHDQRLDTEAQSSRSNASTAPPTPCRGEPFAAGALLPRGEPSAGKVALAHGDSGDAWDVFMHAFGVPRSDHCSANPQSIATENP